MKLQVGKIFLFEKSQNFTLTYKRWYAVKEHLLKPCGSTHYSNLNLKYVSSNNRKDVFVHYKPTHMTFFSL